MLSLRPLQSVRLLDPLRERTQLLRYSRRTEEVYVRWVRRFYIHFYRLRHPNDMGRAEVESFLTWLATERNVAAATHWQALSALPLGAELAATRATRLRLAGASHCD